MSGKLLRTWNKLGSSGVTLDSSFTDTAFEIDYELTDRVVDREGGCELRVGKAKSTAQEVTVKVISKEGLNRKQLRRIKEEFRILRKISHENIVAVHDIYENGEDFYVVTEQLQWPSLIDLLKDETHKFTEEDVREVIRQLCSALHYCFGAGVVHRNIKPANVLYQKVNDKVMIKLKGFTYSKELEEDLMSFSVLETMCGTPAYIAPEVLRNVPYSFKCDVWGVGFLAFLLLSNGFPPFYMSPRDSRAKYYQRLHAGQWDFRPRSAWDSISKEAKDLVKNLLVVDPEKRFSYIQILHHPWLRVKVLKPTLPSNSVSNLGVYDDE